MTASTDSAVSQATAAVQPWRALVVDDEPLARLRMRQLLVDVAASLGCVQILEADSVRAALDVLDACSAEAWTAGAHAPLAVVFADVRMPGADGFHLANVLSDVCDAPQLVFVTAHAQHAVQAFEVQACDYLTKPVGRERLRQAIFRALGAGGFLPEREKAAAMGSSHLRVEGAGRTHHLSLKSVAYVRAELKYLTVGTVDGEYLMEGSLQSLEVQHPGQWVRIHRNAVVNADFLEDLVRFGPAQGAETSQQGDRSGWYLRLRGVCVPLAVSRRQIKIVRTALSKRQLGFIVDLNQTPEYVKH